MEERKPSTAGRWIFTLMLAWCVFMGIFGTLGFLGWWSDPSNQKWAALFCGLLGWAALFATWQSKEDCLYPKPTLESEKVENKTIEEQRQHWTGKSDLCFLLAPVAACWCGSQHLC
jgi:hypothetical protein